MEEVIIYVSIYWVKKIEKIEKNVYIIFVI